MRSNKSEEQVVHYVGRLQLAGKALEDVRAILEDLANQPVPARLAAMRLYGPNASAVAWLPGTGLDRRRAWIRRNGRRRPASANSCANSRGSPGLRAR